MSNTAIAPLETQHDAFIDVPRPDMTRLEPRWGFQVSQRHKPLSRFEYGIHAAPFGKFFMIRSEPRPQENHTTDETKPKEDIVIRSAAEFEELLMQALGGTGAQNQADWGLVTGFVSEVDSGKMAVISATLLPTLSEIREIQSSIGVEVISPVCEGTDELDFGQREQCLTCWAKWINSAVSEQHIERVAMLGRTIVERDSNTQEIREREVRPTISELRTAREMIRQSMGRAIPQLQSLWQTIAAEFESADRIRKDISEYEHLYRKDLHQARPQDRQLAIARETARQVQNGGAGSGEIAAVLDRLTDVVVELKKGQDDLRGQIADTKTVAAVESDVVSTDEELNSSVPDEAVLGGLAVGAQALENAKKSKSKEK